MFLILALATAASAASSFKIIYNFSGGPSGAGPAYGLVSDGKGNFYGMAYGGTKGYGLVFELSPDSAPPKSTRASEPTLSWNQFHSMTARPISSKRVTA